jgi:2-polyprenyl-6-methoxyphenol hydroxylase-like FAD-dependent oxidoreductase
MTLSFSVSRFRIFHELVSFEQNENGVKAKIRNRETEKESVIHCDYVIAADFCSNETNS